jgi:superfamily I DNA/RNA helicase
MIDEAQDLNRAQLELVLRAVAPGGRTLAVGDAGQAIYQWSGADARSMANITARTGACQLPLSICYRCPASHVALAATIQGGRCFKRWPVPWG